MCWAYLWLCIPVKLRNRDLDLVCISSSLVVWKCLHSTAARRLNTHSHLSHLPASVSLCVVISFSASFHVPLTPSHLGPPSFSFSLDTFYLSLLLNDPKVGQSLQSCYLTEEMGNRCVCHQTRRTHAHVDRQTDIMLLCDEDESWVLTLRLPHVSGFLLSSLTLYSAEVG